jgi:hypothetical protein
MTPNNKSQDHWEICLVPPFHQSSLPKRTPYFMVRPLVDKTTAVRMRFGRREPPTLRTRTQTHHHWSIKIHFVRPTMSSCPCHHPRPTRIMVSPSIDGHIPELISNQDVCWWPMRNLEVSFRKRSSWSSIIILPRVPLVLSF